MLYNPAMEFDAALCRRILSDSGFRTDNAWFGTTTDNPANVADSVRQALEDNLFVFVGPWFGDPAPNKVKQLSLYYRDQEGSPLRLEVIQEGSIFIPPPLREGVPHNPAWGLSASGFRVWAAKFGFNGQWIDVTEKARDRIADAYEPFHFSAKDAGSDPCPWANKSTVVCFSNEGKLYVRAIRDTEWTTLLPGKMSFLKKLNPLFWPLAMLRQGHGVSDLEHAIIESGLSNYSLSNYPPGLHSSCGKGLNIWQYPIQFAPYLHKVRGRAASYLEIGTRYGGTFAFTAEYFRRFSGLKRAVGIDLLPAPLMEAISTDRPEWSFIVGNSHDPAVRDGVAAMGPYDVILIDGDHFYDGCKADLDFCIGLGNAIALHDIVDQNFDNGVPKAWAEFKAQHAGEFDFFEFNEQYPEPTAIYKIKFLGIGLAIRKETRR